MTTWPGAWRAARRPRSILAAVALAVAGYLATGVFTVAADEQAVVRRFGRVTARLGPGLHYRLPWPVDRVDVLKTTTVMKTGVGFSLPDGEATSVTGMEILTGDTNIVSVAIAIQFVIANPAAYLFEVETPAVLIGHAAESVLTETVVGMPVDEVLTTGRLAIQERVKSGTQAILDRYVSGIQLTSASIMTITLDSAVAQAFQDVVSASADRENKINEARTYANTILPKARGEAQSLVLAAQGYREQRVAEAVGNSARFLELLAEYSKAPEITRSRLYLEAMEKILPKVKKYVIDSEQGRQPLNLPLSPPRP
jgi:modulator of FtsH protease HflK